MPCRWCLLLGSEGHTVHDEPAFVVEQLRPGSGRPCLTLVPRAHVNVMTELPRPEMAAVLAGLSRASTLLRQSSGAPAVQIHARSRCGHLYFELEPAHSGNSPLEGDPADDGRPRDEVPGGFVTGGGPQPRKRSEPSVFASLVEAIGH
jgi:diadenosine tetraphosphate (Ap4A) HIT family hydrolase